MRSKRLLPSGLIVALIVAFFALPTHSSEIDVASPEELIAVMKANVYLTGDIVKRLDAQDRLVRIGKIDPQAVVPLVIEELSPPRSYGKIAGHQRIAFVELLRDLGPAAEGSVPLLVDILDDPEEPYEMVKSQAAAALISIGTPSANAAAQAYFAGLQQHFASQASAPELERSAEQSAYFVRQQLRQPEPSDRVIAASVSGLRDATALPDDVIQTLLRAFGDPRLSSGLHRSIGLVLQNAGIADPEAAAADTKMADGAPDILAEVILDTKHSDELIRGLAMTELGQMKASEPAVDALILALREDRNPGDAARVLGEYGEPAERALPDIARYFDDERAGANAIQAVGRIGVPDPRIVLSLREILATPGHPNRAISASALASLGASEALPELRQALADGGKYERLLAAQALGRLGAAAAPATAALAGVLDDPDKDIRTAAVTALGQIGEQARSTVPHIADQLDSEDLTLRNAAQGALLRIGGPEAEGALKRDAERYLEADLAQVRQFAATGDVEDVADSLARLPKARAISLAQRLLSDPSQDLAYLGALFLVQEGQFEGTVPILADNLARRPDAERSFTLLAFSLAQGGRRGEVEALLEGIGVYVEENRVRYSQDEILRLKRMGFRLQ